jgi:hypothetical protein
VNNAKDALSQGHSIIQIGKDLDLHWQVARQMTAKSSRAALGQLTNAWACNLDGSPIMPLADNPKQDRTANGSVALDRSSATPTCVALNCQLFF